MVKAILQVLLFNLPETFFLMTFISLLYCHKIKINIKFILLLFLISFISNYIEDIGILGNFIGMILYYFTYRIFYFNGKRKKLILTILGGFSVLLIVQYLCYKIISCLFSLNFIMIHTKMFYLLAIELLMYICLYLLLLIIFRKRCCK